MNYGYTGHGHVYPREDGMKARCGGPMVCSVCAKEHAMKLASDQAARRERDWPKDFQGWRTMHSAPKDGSWFQGLTTHDNVVACQFIAEDTEEGDAHGSNEFGLPGGVRFMLKAWQPLARPSHEAARREAEADAPPPPAPDLDGLTYRLRARGTASDDQEWHDKDCLKAADAISALRARAEAAEADATKLRAVLQYLQDCGIADHANEVVKEALAQGGNDG